MHSWLIVTALTIVLIVGVLVLLLLYWDIRKMTNQLEAITHHVGTNELVRTNTHRKTLKRLITAINRLIHAFKQNQQYKEKREKELKQEITNISHDLRTPLTSIKGFSELLTDPSLTEAQKEEFLTIIQKKIDNLTMMVDSFYALSQMDSMDHQMVLERQLLNQMVVESMLMFHDDFEKKSLQVHLDEGKVSPILADEKAANRIVLNIIQNALRYAKTYFTVKLTDEEEYVRLRAINDVDEVDGRELHRMFERTFTMDESRTDGQLGLGLHIVQQLITKQEGTVFANVQENEFRLDVYFKKWE